MKEMRACSSEAAHGCQVSFFGALELFRATVLIFAFQVFEVLVLRDAAKATHISVCVEVISQDLICYWALGVWMFLAPLFPSLEFLQDSKHFPYKRSGPPIAVATLLSCLAFHQLSAV